MLSKTFSQIQTETEIDEVDVDTNPELTAQYKIRGVPTVVMLDNDVEVKRFVGVKSKEEIEHWINN
jgi:thioredoxin-like negative regulator of GroEL